MQLNQNVTGIQPPIHNIVPKRIILQQHEANHLKNAPKLISSNTLNLQPIPKHPFQLYPTKLLSLNPQVTQETFKNMAHRLLMTKT